MLVTGKPPKKVENLNFPARKGLGGLCSSINEGEKGEPEKEGVSRLLKGRGGGRSVFWATSILPGSSQLVKSRTVEKGM